MSRNHKEVELPGNNDTIVAKTTNGGVPGLEEGVPNQSDETRGHIDQQADKNEEAKRILIMSANSAATVKSSLCSVDIGNGTSKIPSESKNDGQEVIESMVTSHTTGGVDEKDEQLIVLNIEGSVVQTVPATEGPETSVADKMVFPRCEYAISKISKYL